MKKKSLKTQLEETNQLLRDKISEVNDLANENYNYRKAEEKRNQFKINELESDYRLERGFSEKLLEIIRWQIKPSTAEHPFDKALEQKSERDGSNYKSF